MRAHHGRQAVLGTRYTLLRPGIVAYQDAWDMQQRIAAGVREGGGDVLILLQHPPTYTLGARGKTEHLLLSQEAYLSRGATVHRTDRGGDVTFHGPGQVVGYPIVNIRARGAGPVSYVRALEAMLIDVLGRFGIEAGRSERNAGVWVGDAKIAAIGVRVSRGVTTHGFALNVNTDLSYFEHIVPCGLADASVTSIQALTGETFDIGDVEMEVAGAFARTFDMAIGHRFESEDAMTASHGLEAALGR
jgi:lipoate-protein ligase B